MSKKDKMVFKEISLEQFFDQARETARWEEQLAVIHNGLLHVTYLYLPISNWDIKFNVLEKDERLSRDDYLAIKGMAGAIFNWCADGSMSYKLYNDKATLMSVWQDLKDNWDYGDYKVAGDDDNDDNVDTDEGEGRDV